MIAMGQIPIYSRGTEASCKIQPYIQNSATRQSINGQLDCDFTLAV